MGFMDQHSTWVEIDLEAIEANIGYFLQRTSKQFMAIVKAEAYGHGSVQIAKVAHTAGANWLGVARVGEALELRAAGLDGPILILGWSPQSRLEELILSGVSITFWSNAQLDQISHAGNTVSEIANVHLKVDTGMSRVGATTSVATRLAHEIEDRANVYLEGIFTHLASADEPDQSTTDSQVEVFHTLIQDLEKAGLRPELVHCANSAAALRRPETWYDLVRVGIGMYGLHPSDTCQLPEVVKPVLAWKSSLAQVKVLPSGQGISYGHTYSTSSEERIGTIPVGYADGFRRHEENNVLVGGKQVPVVGRVTMDQIMVQLDAIPTAQPGDEVVIIGSQEGNRISAEDVADRWGTINYEVTSAISHRVPRVYI